MPFRLASSALNGGTNTVPASGRTGTLAPIPDTATTTPAGGTRFDRGTRDTGDMSRRPGGFGVIPGGTVLTELATLIPGGGILTEPVANLGTPGAGPSSVPGSDVPPPGTADGTGGTGSDSDSGGAFGRLADAFIAALGPQVSKKEDTTPYVVVDPNQGAQASGASVNFKTILIVAGCSGRLRALVRVNDNVRGRSEEH